MSPQSEQTNGRFKLGIQMKKHVAQEEHENTEHIPTNTALLMNIDCEMRRIKLIAEKGDCLSTLMFRLQDESEVRGMILKLVDELMEVKISHLIQHVQQINKDETFALMKLIYKKSRCLRHLTFGLRNESGVRDMILELCNEIMKVKLSHLTQQLGLDERIERMELVRMKVTCLMHLTFGLSEDARYIILTMCNETMEV